MTVIETQRLTLRPFTMADLPEFFAMQADKQVNRFLPWFPPATTAEATQMLTELQNATSGLHLAVCLRQTGELLGYINVDDGGAHDLGYGLTRCAQGHGYMTEAAQAVLVYLRKHGWPFVTATHDVRNPKSGAVMQRLGMIYQYSYEEQWQPKNELVTFRIYQLSLDGKARPAFPLYWQQSTVHMVEKLRD